MKILSYAASVAVLLLLAACNLTKDVDIDLPDY